MTNSKGFLNLTAGAAWFSLREFFRPLLAVSRFLKFRIKGSTVRAPASERQANLDEAKTLVR